MPAMNTLLIALALTVGGNEIPDPIRVAPGMSLTLRQPGLTRIAIGREDLAFVKVIDGADFLLMGRVKGRTNITLWANGKSITRQVIVDDNHTVELERAVKSVVDGKLKFESVADKTVIMGTLDSMEELHRLQVLVGDDPDVKLLVELNPALLPVIAQQITTSLHKHGMPYAQANAIGSRIVLEGSVADQDEYRKAQLIADSYFALVAAR
jgi:hypothetical protein